MPADDPAFGHGHLAPSVNQLAFSAHQWYLCA
ncbi:hypothetical protein EDB98_107223 [Pseudomonas fluorescens]|nr:hypothetical protein EDB98_107223 [Pseudomonas fluorescens]